jgi:hypothetical protein
MMEYADKTGAAAMDGLIDEALGDYLGRVTLADSLIRRLRSNRLTEAVRRHLEGLTFKSTYNADRIRAIEASIVKLRSELRPLVEAAQVKLVQIEFAERELAAYKAAEQRVLDERAIRNQTGMYVEPTRFTDCLYDAHGIHRGHFAALTDEDITAIAEIMQSRYEPLAAADAMNQAVADAKEF